MASTTLKAGDSAPPIDATDIDGNPVRLTDRRGSPVLLSFYRYVTCPVCNLRIQQLAQHQDRLPPELRMIAVFESPPADLREFVGKRGLPFPLIGDGAGRLFERYGVRRSWLGTLVSMLRLPLLVEATRAKDYSFQWTGGRINRIPADFLIDERGRILTAHYGQQLDDHLAFQAIRSALGRPVAA